MLRSFVWGPRSEAEGVSPTHFSALIVSVKPRDTPAMSANYPRVSQQGVSEEDR